MHILCLQLEPHATSLPLINVDIWDGITELAGTLWMNNDSTPHKDKDWTESMSVAKSYNLIPGIIRRRTWEKITSTCKYPIMKLLVINSSSI